MGYLSNVVQSGKQLADRYNMPEYVEKARQTLPSIAVEKIDLLCEQGSPYLAKVDEITEARIQATLVLANAKVEQAQTIRTEVMGAVAQKKTEVVDITKATTAKVHATTSEALSIAQQTKAKAIEKVAEKKILAYKMAQETGTMAIQKASDVCEASTKKIEKTETGKKVVGMMLMAKESVASYGSLLVKTSLALPMTLQERMDKGLTYTKGQVGPSVDAAQKKGLAAYESMKTKFADFPPMMRSMGIDLDVYRAMYEKYRKVGFATVCKNEYKALMQNKVSPFLKGTQARITKKYAAAERTFKANIVLAKAQLKAYEEKAADYCSQFKGMNMAAAKSYATGVKAQIHKFFGDVLVMMKKSKAQ